MSVRVNFTDVQSGGFPVLPAGRYHVKVTDGELKASGEKAKNPGAPYINWEFTVQPTHNELAGRKLWMITSMLPQALFGLKGLLEATQRFNADQLSGDIDFDIDDVMGADLIVVVKVKAETEEYEARNEVRSCKPYTEGAMVSSGAGTDGSVLP